jgi:hypothetical protein
MRQSYCYGHRAYGRFEERLFAEPVPVRIAAGPRGLQQAIEEAKSQLCVVGFDEHGLGDVDEI